MTKPVGSKQLKAPVRFSRALMEDICDRIARGQTLSRICKDDGMPTKGAVMQWVSDDLGGCTIRYENARLKQAMAWADELVDIADDGTNDTYVKISKDGEESLQINVDVVQRSRLRVETRKWLLAKALPKVYGDKLDLTHGGELNVHHTGFGVLLAAAKASSQTSLISGKASDIDSEEDGEYTRSNNKDNK